ncbi:hypothetical protein JCM39068_23610 [Desulfocastanea catecholica]
MRGAEDTRDVLLDGFGQVVLACDEDGVLTWHFPEDVFPTEVVSRAADRRTYRLRTHMVGAPIPGNRGLMGALGKKLLKVLAFKVVDKALGAVGDFFVSRWEKEHRPHRLRSFTPGDYRRLGGATLGATELANLAGGPALMFIHGTASQGHQAFRAIPETALAKLDTRYQGRVFAFEHPTLSVSPTDNVRWLSKELSRLLGSGSGLTLDLVAHSRGGLVGRILCEQPVAAGLDPQHLRVRQLLMVATPNAGTPLGDRAHLNTFIDTMTNLLEFIPDNPATDTLEVLLTLLKQLAVTTAYRALAANFEPSPGTPLGRYARDHLTDQVFMLEPNDLVVPTKGVYTANGATGFPIEEIVTFFAPADAVDHSGFWTKPAILEAFDRWLTG